MLEMYFLELLSLSNITFLLADRILRKIGHVHAMSLVLFAFGARFVIYSYLKNPWWCLPVELFQGFTFGLFYATMASYASIVAPPGTEATMQGTVGAVFEGIGKYLYHHHHRHHHYH
jgi:MFS family permease